MSQGVFGDLSTEDFLSQYWQQKPLLVRSAFEVPELSFDAGELAGLACDTEAPSRIVLEHGEQPWQLKQGPFEEADFTSLPQTHWTLLINDIENYFPELRDFITPFRFIPDWRIDDLMISYAADQGSVGPHVDQYDVFLIQLEGKRAWSIDDRQNYDTTPISGPTLKILQNFSDNHSWTLEPGDMLYLPPNVPHHGVADGECMTLSVGFRAPSRNDLVQAWLDQLSAAPSFKKRFSDPMRAMQSNPGEISATDTQALRQLILEGIEEESASLDSWLGKYLTESKLPDPALTEDLPEHPDDYDATCDYERYPGLRIAYTLKQDAILLFVGGNKLLLDLNLLSLVQYLCKEHYYSANELAAACTDQEACELVNTLIKNNNIVLTEPESCISQQEFDQHS